MMCMVCVCGGGDLFQFRQNLSFLLLLDCIFATSYELFLGILRRALCCFQIKLSNTSMRKDFGDVTSQKEDFLSLEKLQVFSWSHWIWWQAQPLQSQKKWKHWSRTKVKRNFKRPLPGRRKGGEGSGCQKRKDLSLLMYSHLERAGSFLRGWRFLNQSKQQRWQAKILLS